MHTRLPRKAEDPPDRPSSFQSWVHPNKRRCNRSGQPDTLAVRRLERRMAMPPPQPAIPQELTSPFGQAAGLPLATPGVPGYPSALSAWGGNQSNTDSNGYNAGLIPSGSTVQSVYPPGAAVLRLLEYCDGLSGKGSINESEVLRLNFWRDLTDEFYLPDGVFRQVAWNPAAREQRAFELPTPVIPRYLHTVHLSGVVSHSTSLARPREWSLGNLSSIPPPPVTKGAMLGTPNGKTTHFVQVEKAKAHVEYENGWMVVQTGILRAAFTPFRGSLKLQFLDFIITHHESFVPRARITRAVNDQALSDDLVQRIRDAKRSGAGSSGESRREGKKEGEGQGKDDKTKNALDREDKFSVPVERWTMPDNPVNEYGMTLRAMRCLEITESVCQLRDLMDFSAQNSLGPMQALRRLASEFSKARASTTGGDRAGGRTSVGPPNTRAPDQTPGSGGGTSQPMPSGNGPGMAKRKNTATSAQGDVKTEGDDGDPLNDSNSSNKRSR
ncbi:unnamed protein product [Parajaminaea phylloscopi]